MSGLEDTRTQTQTHTKLMIYNGFFSMVVTLQYAEKFKGDEYLQSKSLHFTAENLQYNSLNQEYRSV